LEKFFATITIQRGIVALDVRPPYQEQLPDTVQPRVVSYHSVKDFLFGEVANVATSDGTAQQGQAPDPSRILAVTALRLYFDATPVKEYVFLLPRSKSALAHDVVQDMLKTRLLSNWETYKAKWELPTPHSFDEFMLYSTEGALEKATGAQG
jgi:hypothetical protein